MKNKFVIVKFSVSYFYSFGLKFFWYGYISVTIDKIAFIVDTHLSIKRQYTYQNVLILLLIVKLSFFDLECCLISILEFRIL